MWRGSAGEAVLASVSVLWGIFVLIFGWRNHRLPVSWFGEEVPATSCLFLVGIAGAAFLVCFGVLIVALRVAL